LAREIPITIKVDGRQAKRGTDQATDSLSNLKRRADETSRSTSAFQQRLNRLGGAAQRVQSSVVSLQGALVSLGAALATRQLVRFTQQALQTAESIGDVSQRTGIAAERLQGLRRAFDQNGGSAQQLDAALSRFNRRIGLAQEGTGAAAKSIERLNIQLNNARGDARATGDVLNDVIEVIQGIESASERSAVASRFFGEEAGPKLAPLLAQGTDAINQYTEQLREAGVLFRGELVQSAGQASASLRRFNEDVGTAFQIGLLESFVSETGRVEDSLKSLRSSAREFGEAAGNALTFAARAAQKLSDNLDLVITALSATAAGRLLRVFGTLTRLFGAAATAAFTYQQRVGEASTASNTLRQASQRLNTVLGNEVSAQGQAAQATQQATREKLESAKATLAQIEAQRQLNQTVTEGQQRPGANVAREQGEQVSELRSEIENLEAGLAQLNTQELLGNVGDTADQTAASMSDLNNVLEFSEQVFEGNSTAVQGVIESLRQEIELVGASREERRLSNALRQAGVDLTSEQGQQIAALVGELESERQAQERANETLRIATEGYLDLQNASMDAGSAVNDNTDATRELTTAQKEAQRTIEKTGDVIQDSIVDTFDLALDGFQDMDGALERFARNWQSLTASVLAQPLTLPIRQAFGGASAQRAGITGGGGAQPSGAGTAGLRTGLQGAQAGLGVSEFLSSGKTFSVDSIFSGDVFSGIGENLTSINFGGTTGGITTASGSPVATGQGAFAAPGGTSGGFSIPAGSFLQGGLGVLDLAQGDVGSGLGNLGGAAALATLPPPFNVIGSLGLPILGSFFNGAFEGGAAGTFPAARADIGKDLQISKGFTSDSGDIGPFKKQLEAQRDLLTQLAGNLGLPARLQNEVSFGAASGLGSAERESSPKRLFVGGAGGLKGDFTRDPSVGTFKSGEEASSALFRTLFSQLDLDQLEEELRNRIETALENSAEDADPGKLAENIQFAAGFEDRVEALNKGVQSLSETISGQAEQNLSNLTTNVSDFLDKTEELGLGIDKAKDASAEFLKRQLGIVDAVDPEQLSSAAQEQIRLNTTLEQVQDPTSDFRELLDRVGISAENAADGIREQIKENQNLKKAQVRSRLLPQDAQQAGSDLLGFLQGQGQFALPTLQEDANRGILSQELVDRFASDQFDAILGGLEVGALEDLRDLFQRFADTIPNAERVLEALNQEIKNTSDLLQRGERLDIRSQFADLFDPSVIEQLIANGLGGTDTAAQVLEGFRTGQRRNGLAQSGQEFFANRILQQASAEGLSVEETTRALDIFASSIEEVGQQAERWAQVNRDLGQTLDDILIGSDSPLDPEAQFQRARENFRGTLSRAQGGDIEAAQNLSEEASTFASQIRSFLGSGPEAAQAFERLRSGVQSVRDVAESGGTPTETETTVPEGLKQFRDTLAALDSDAISLDDALSRFGTTLDNLPPRFDPIRGIFDNFLADLQDGTGTTQEAIDTFLTKTDALPPQFATIFDTINKGASGIPDQVKSSLDATQPFIDSFFATFGDRIKGLNEAANDLFGDLVGGSSGVALPLQNVIDQIDVGPGARFRDAFGDPNRFLTTGIGEPGTRGGGLRSFGGRDVTEESLLEGGFVRGPTVTNDKGQRETLFINERNAEEIKGLLNSIGKEIARQNNGEDSEGGDSKQDALIDRIDRLLSVMENAA